jgi:hypothetical protein
LLAASRDADVIAAATIELGQEDSGEAPVVCRGALAQSEADACAVEAVTENLNDLHNDIVEFIASGSFSIDGLCASIEREFHAMTRARRHFLNTGRKHDAHEWRKMVQRCANQIKLIETLLPQFAAVRGAKLDTLAEVLGDFNDLTILRRALKSKQPGLQGTAAKELRRCAKARQKALKKLALKVGDAIGV